MFHWNTEGNILEKSSHSLYSKLSLEWHKDLVNKSVIFFFGWTFPLAFLHLNFLLLFYTVLPRITHALNLVIQTLGLWRVLLPLVTLLYRTMENNLCGCFVLTRLCPFNEIKVSPLTWKAPHALSFSGVRVPERRFLNSSFRLIVRICETSDHWSPKRTGLRSAERFAPRKECRTERQHFRKVKCRCWLSATPFLLFSWCFKCQTLMDSLQTGGFTNSEFSCGLQLCKHSNTRHLRRHQRTTLLMIYALSLQWLKSKHWQNGPLMVSPWLVG